VLTRPRLEAMPPSALHCRLAKELADNRQLADGSCSGFCAQEAKAVSSAGDSGAGRNGGDGLCSPACIYLARHGRTPLNAAGALRGRLNVALDTVGEHQAALLGEVLGQRKPRLVASSPLRRALETAKAIAHIAGTGTWVDDRLIDRDYGPWTGKAVADVIFRWGSLDAAPGVEPEENVRARALAALVDIAENLDGATAVVVSHDAVNRIALASLDASLDEPAFLLQETGCFNTVEYHKARGGPARWRVVTVNEVPFDGDGQS
jgi:broad specificity phosphatase PhoE